MFSSNPTWFIFEICCFMGNRGPKTNYSLPFGEALGIGKPPKYTSMVRVPEGVRCLSQPFLSSVLKLRWKLEIQDLG